MFKNNYANDDGDNDDQWEFVCFTFFRRLSQLYFRFQLEMLYSNPFLNGTFSFEDLASKIQKGNILKLHRILLNFYNA